VTKPTEDTHPNIPHQKKSHILITEHEVKSLMYADQTGLFPAVSSLGNKYVMISHHVDSNSTWSEAIRNQSGGKLILARARALARMQRQGLIAKHQILDNQASAEYKAAIEASGMTYELVPPDEHQRNMAEKAIQTFKDHFVGVLSGCAPSMPIHLWCQLLPQSNVNSFSSDNPGRILTYPHTHMSTNNTTTTDIHLFPLAWRH
jgi:hypothetical protein